MHLSNANKVRKSSVDKSVRPVDDRIVIYADIERMAGFKPPCRVHLRRLIEKKQFPQPVQLSENRIGWWLSELRGHLLSRPRV